jgi:hypothetical protein
MCRLMRTVIAHRTHGRGRTCMSTGCMYMKGRILRRHRTLYCMHWYVH